MNYGAKRERQRNLLIIEQKERIRDLEKGINDLLAALGKATNAIGIALMAQSDHEAYPGSPEQKSIDEALNVIRATFDKTAALSNPRRS